MRNVSFFFRDKLFRSRTEEVQVNAATVQFECHTYVKQMALPLIAERRVKGALSMVSRDTGLSYSKVRKIYYGLTDHILAFEWRNIAEAYKRHVENQERKLEAELATLRALREAREIRENQLALDIAPLARDMGAHQGASHDRVRDHQG